MRSQDDGGANADVNLMEGMVETMNFGDFGGGLEKGRWLTVFLGNGKSIAIFVLKKEKFTGNKTKK